jgi:hypothetical protein
MKKAIPKILVIIVIAIVIGSATISIRREWLGIDSDREGWEDSINRSKILEEEFIKRIEEIEEEVEKEAEKKEIAESNNEWEDDFEIALDDLEKGFDCMREAGVDVEPLVETYFECVFENCMDLAMTDEEADACVEDCASPIYVEFSKLEKNRVFRRCVEDI